MNKWIKSFLLHPFLNRFNILYFATWTGIGIFTEVPHVFIAGLAIELAYLAARATIDGSTDNPLLQIRKLPFLSRKRYFAAVDKSDNIRRDFESADAKSKLLNQSLIQTKRLTTVFLDLLIMEKRLTDYLRSVKENHDAKIEQLQKSAESSEGEVKALAERNIEIYQRRKEKHEQTRQKMEVIQRRLETIENTLALLADTAIGIKTPEDTQNQVEHLLTNVEDAEVFLSDIRQASESPFPEKVR